VILDVEFAYLLVQRAMIEVCAWITWPLEAPCMKKLVILGSGAIQPQKFAGVVNYVAVAD
jgi:hypothetical protein